MARNVFISTLGTNCYGNCIYTKGKFESGNTRFIQIATLEYIQYMNKNRNWQEGETVWETPDCLIFLLTEEAREVNWNKSITSYTNKMTGKVTEEYVGLEKVLEDKGWLSYAATDTDKNGNPVYGISISDGKDETQMWEIFSILFRLLQKDDQLYIDVTHGFRYMPMLVIVLENYAKFLKNISVKHISYGNYEARNKETNKAPFMDILSLSVLQDWTRAAADLIHNGNATRLKELAGDGLTQMIKLKGKQNMKRKVVEQPWENYANLLEKVTQEFNLCHGYDILKGESIGEMRSNFERLEENKSGLIAPILPILETINESFKAFETPNDDNYGQNTLIVKNGYLAAKWCLDHQLYQQAVTIALETIVTQTCLYFNFTEEEWRNYDNRGPIGKLIRSGYTYNEDDWKGASLSSRSRHNVQSIDLGNIGIREYYLKINNMRNVYNHAGMTVGKDKRRNAEGITLDDINEFSEMLDRLIQLTDKYPIKY